MPGTAQPRRRRRQAEWLAAQVVGAEQNDVHGRSTVPRLSAPGAGMSLRIDGTSANRIKPATMANAATAPNNVGSANDS